MKRRIILTVFFLTLCIFVDANKQDKDVNFKASIYLTFQAENGNYKQLINDDGTFTCIIDPANVIRINSILFNGSDVTQELNGNQYTTPILIKNSTLDICFDSIATVVQTKYYTIASLDN